MPAEERTIRHEAGHVCGALWLGKLPVEISVDRPDDGLAGRVSMDVEASELGFGDLVVIAMGPIAEGAEPPAWRPRADADDLDERAMGAIIDYFAFDEEAHRLAIEAARRLLGDHRIQAVHSLLCGALARIPTLNQSERRFLLGPEHLATFQIPATEEALWSI